MGCSLFLLVGFLASLRLTRFLVSLRTLGWSRVRENEAKLLAALSSLPPAQSASLELEKSPYPLRFKSAFVFQNGSN